MGFRNLPAGKWTMGAAQETHFWPNKWGEKYEHFELELNYLKNSGIEWTLESVLEFMLGYWQDEQRLNVIEYL